ncbi:ferritin-like domain-containing protein [Sphingomonas sp. ac-8]|uniref:ferritin-like domain-containing protein n=1 Tax=Sphingomonas sp. ac-8 TaxID=3242977 RepID=UPI003A80DA60
MNIESKRQVVQAIEQRRAERRQFLRYAGTATAMAGGLSLLAACDDNDDDFAPAPSPTPTPTPSASSGSSDVNILNFALNLEYLEAQFYSFATTGASIPGSLLSGVGKPGAIQGGRAVTFTDPVVAQYAREIAADEQAHVAFLRKALGSAAVAQPAIDIGGGANGPFTAAARAAGVIGGNETFDPYASDENFLLAAYIFEDVGVSAYKGAAPLITSTTYIDASAGILAAEAYHAGLIRTTLYAKGIETPSLITSANQISDARDSLDGSSDLDQGITMDGAANIVPADANGIAFSRSTAQVLNIVYLNAAATGAGGFFPVGVNGAFVTSGAN